MHDFLSDTDDPATATKICYEVSNILAQGCFPLRKWISNKPEILKNIINVDDENSIVAVGKGENTKTLGLFWSPTEDHLVFKVNDNISDSITKGSIISAISQIFDPLGLLGPCTISVKIILQGIWKEKLDWDDQVADITLSKRAEIKENIHLLNEIFIPRHALAKNSRRIELHGYLCT